MPRHIRFSNVSFSYPASVDPVLEGVTFGTRGGWTGVVGANGAGKSTLIRLAVGALKPTGGAVDSPGGLYCAQRTDHPPESLDAFMNEWDPRAIELKDVLGIEYDWMYRWPTLSHGERKRLQMAVALWRVPEVLAVDEPTNHVDADARRAVSDALASYEGTGLIVSHDRALLDRLCTTTLVVGGGAVEVRSGNVSHALAQEEVDLLSDRRERRDAARLKERVTTEYRRRTQRAQSASRGYSKRNLDARDSGARFDIDVSRITGKDGRAGRLKKQFDQRLRDAEERLDAATTRRPVLSATASLNLSGRTAPGDLVVRMPPGSLSLGPDRVLRHPELIVRPGDRIHLAGPNGAGKSTLLHALRGVCADGTLYMPQEFGSAEVAALRDRLSALSNEERGRVLAVFHQLGSDPDRARTTERWSPGEERKLLLALGTLDAPALLLLDEPTNHLDLPSILALDAALAEQYAAVVLVTHDDRFAAAVTNLRWEIRGGPKGVVNVS